MYINNSKAFAHNYVCDRVDKYCNYNYYIIYYIIHETLNTYFPFKIFPDNKYH